MATTTASTSSPPAPTRHRVLHAGSLAMIISGLMVVVGSLLPWAMVAGGVSFPGTAGGGLFTLSAGFIAVAGALLPYRKLAIAHCLLPGIAAAAIVIAQVIRIIYLSAITDAWLQILPGMGLVMVGGGAVVLLRTAYRLIRTT